MEYPFLLIRVIREIRGLISSVGAGRFVYASFRGYAVAAALPAVSFSRRLSNRNFLHFGITFLAHGGPRV
jgi:hypothetical protein